VSADPNVVRSDAHGTEDAPARSGQTIQIVVVDDHEMVRTGFAEVLRTQPDFTVVGTAADGAEAVRLCRDRHPDVVLMDVRMPVMDGISATKELVAGPGNTPSDALCAGASGFLLKDVTAEQLFDAVRVVARGDALLAPTVTRRLISEFARIRSTDAPPFTAAMDVLTPRETEVLRLVAEGLSNGEIAARLVVSDETVKTHVSRVLSKLGVRDRTQVVVAAYESGLVTPRRGRAVEDQ
jgi:DNA-binding NarL/FixJ family response regulator